jgi:hypothetical protein
LAWVECRPSHLRIQTPFYPLAVSYGRIKEVLPRTFAQIHDPSKEKAARREWLSPYWGRTVTVVRLTKYPVKRSWLRLWLSPYLMTPKTPGFVFTVEDWMALSRQIDDFRSAWEQYRTEKRQEKLADRTW